MDKFEALADPTRRRIVEMLAARGRLSATEIAGQFSSSAPAISQHLKVLREARLVLMENRAQQHIYRINPEAVLQVEDWARGLRQLWDERFDALDRVLGEEKQKASDEASKEVGSAGNLQQEG